MSFLNKTLPLSVFILYIAVNSMCVSPSLSFSSIFSPPNLSLSLSASWLFCFLVRCNFPYITDLLWLMLIDNFFFCVVRTRVQYRVGSSNLKKNRQKKHMKHHALERKHAYWRGNAHLNDIFQKKFPNPFLIPVLKMHKLIHIHAHAQAQAEIIYRNDCI